MTTAHTPGPWEAFHIDVRTAGPRSRAVCWAGSPNIALRRARANARLIAAAPDLLAALIDMVRFVGTDGHALAMIPEDTWDAARHAITKATTT